jgi:hypothetical protein
MSAKEHAEELAWYFLKKGCFVASKKMPNGGISDAAQGTSNDTFYQIETLEFSGLPVEAVGYEVNKDGTSGTNIYIHITGRGKARQYESSHGETVNVIPAAATPPIDLRRFSTHPNRVEIYMIYAKWQDSLW